MANKLKTETYDFGADTKGTILSASLACFNDFGYGGATLTEIAKRAKMSKPRVLYHYASPDLILIDLAKVWAETGRAVTVEALASQVARTPEDGLIVGALANFAWAERYPEIASLTSVLVHASSHVPGVAEIQRHAMEIGLKRIIVTLGQCEKFKKTPKAQIESVARSIHCLIVGGILYILSQGHLKDINLYRRDLEKAIRHLMT